MTTQMRNCAGVMMLHILRIKLFYWSPTKTFKHTHGKADFEDHHNLKTTSLRELGEETI